LRRGRGWRLRSRNRRRGDRLARTGQPDKKSRSPPRLGMLHQIELPLRFAHQLAGDVEAQPRAAYPFRTREGAEQSRRDLRRHSGTVVGDRHADPAARVVGEGIDDQPAGRFHAAQGIEGVAQQIDDDLFQPIGIPDDRRELGIEPPFDRDFVDAEAVGDQVDRAADHIVHVHLRGPLGLAQDALHLVALLGREVRVCQPQLGMARDRHQRVVDLVRDAAQQLARRRKAPLFLGAIPQHARHVIEVRRDLAQFVVATDRDLRGQIAFGDTLNPAA